MTRIVAWQPLLTDHQRHTLDALGAIAGDIRYVVGRTSDAERDRQGWARVDATVAVLPSRGAFDWARRRLREDRDAVHIFCSPFEDPRLIAILGAALWSRARVWLVSEPWSDSVHGYFSAAPTVRDTIKAYLRPVLYRGYGLALRGRLAGVFAISPLAVRQYRAIGIAPERVHPFGYFVPAAAPIPVPSARSGTGLRLAFVGALIPRKGLGDLVAAVNRLTAAGIAVTLDVYGPGDPADTGDRVRYRGRIPFGETAAVVADYDLLVVPSRHDGWGVVVNEALQGGTPVIASDRTGAGAMVARWGCGARFPAGDAAELASVIAAIAGDPVRYAAMRAAAVAFAPQLEPAVAARYMAAAIDGTPIANPWFDA